MTGDPNTQDGAIIKNLTLSKGNVSDDRGEGLYNGLLAEDDLYTIIVVRNRPYADFLKWVNIDG
jgi:hypothetical protein